MPLDRIETADDAVAFTIHHLTEHGAECEFTLANGGTVYGTVTDDGLFLPAPDESRDMIGVATLLHFPQPRANELPTWVRDVLPQFMEIPGAAMPGTVWTLVKGGER